MRGLCGLVLGGGLTLAAFQFVLGDVPVLLGLQLTLANLGVDLAQRLDATRGDRDLLTDLLLLFDIVAAVETPRRGDAGGRTLQLVDAVGAEALVEGVHEGHALDVLAVDARHR